MASSIAGVRHRDTRTETAPRPWPDAFADAVRISLMGLLVFAVLLPIVGYTPVETAVLLILSGLMVVPYWTVVERYFIPRFP